jgi:hypothetical protein
MVVELILERGRGLTCTPRRESRFRGPRSIDRFAAVLEPGAQSGETREGSLWIAKRTTAAFPGGNAEPDAWQLTSKRGADGKDAR